MPVEPPDIEEALRNPANEQAYKGDYNKALSERALPVIEETLKEDPTKDATLEVIKPLFEGQQGTVIVQGKVVKALSEAGLLRVRSVIARKGVDPKDGWVQHMTTPEGWSGPNSQPMEGIVEEYFVELPESERSAPITTRLKLEAKQQKLKGEKNRYGGDMWGDIDYNKWTLTRSSLS
jgi:hypothetical protein